MDSAAEGVVSVAAKEDMAAAKEDMAAAKEDMAAVAAVAREDSVVVAEEGDGEGRIKANNEC